METTSTADASANEATSGLTSNFSRDPDIFAQHVGYVILGSVCMLTNALALHKFFKEAKTHQYIGQRPLLLSALLADFLNGLTFTSAGGVELARSSVGSEAENATIYENASALWTSCMRTFYTPALLFLQAFMATVITCSSVDRLTAVATPIFYAQCVKPRHCYMLLTVILLASAAILAAAYSADAQLASTATPSSWFLTEQWPASACIAPFANAVLARYLYGGLCSLITVSIAIDLLALFSYKKVSLQRTSYETSQRDYGVTVRNYLPRHAFGHSDTPSPTNNSAHRVTRPNQDRPPSRHAFDSTTSGGCSVPLAMSATILTVSALFLVPCVFFWFASGIPGKQDARDRYGAGRRMAGYVAWGFLIYSLINSLIFFMIRKDLRKGLRSLVLHTRAYCRCLCMSLNPTAVCETTPVEVIGDPMTASASSSTLSSLASLPRMKKQRPSIVPLAYGTTEM